MNNTIPQELVQNLTSFCQNRKAVYTFLARCFEREIDKECALRVARDFWFESDNEELNDDVKALKAALAEPDELSLEHIAVTYNKVFYGMGPRTAQKAFPYESVYTSSGGLMMQAAYSEVKSLYASDGFIKNPDFTEPEDHLAIELSYMAELCEQSIEQLALRNEDEATQALQKQLEFLQEHLLNWIPSFAADVKGSAEEGFYWHLGSFTESFLENDVQALSEVLD